jgi:uncharacterized protein YukE
MATSQIRVDATAFSLASSKQRLAAAQLEALHNREQAVFGNLASTWKGASGTAFRACAIELSTETLSGIFMITILAAQTVSAKTTFETVDRTLASSLTKQKKK